MILEGIGWPFESLHSASNPSSPFHDPMCPGVSNSIITQKKFCFSEVLDYACLPDAPHLRVIKNVLNCVSVVCVLRTVRALNPLLS